MVDVLYYSRNRPEVLQLVPQGVRHVIDVGCGAGALGAAIKQERVGAEVRGIEVQPVQAALARKVLDDAIALPADGPMPPGWPAPDCMIFADVLEHLVDPWETLRIWRDRAQGGAWLVVSLPNVAHASVLADLLRGRWQYVDEGVLDRTHLRFFTRESAVALIEQAGFRIESMNRVLAVPNFVPWKNWWMRWARKGNEAERSGLRMRAFRRAILDAFTYQFLFVARAAARGIGSNP